MKKVMLLIFGALVGIPAICQMDTVHIFSASPTPMNDTLMFPTDLFKRGVSVVKLLPIKLRKATKVELMMGMDAVYIPETDVQGGNATRSKTIAIVYQHPVSVPVTQAQLDQVSAAIKNILEPVVVPQPDVITDIDNVVAQTANKYSAGWLHYANNTWNANHLNNTISVTYTAGSTLEVTFNGYKCEWWSEPRMNHGIAGLSIDGGPEVEVDLYDKRSDNITAKIWTSPNLTAGVHVLKIRMLNKKNPAWQTDFPVGHAQRAQAQETNIIHDYVKVFKRP